MEIRKDTVVSFDYTLTNDKGEQLDTSQGGQPLVYLQGHQQIIPGLEAAMEGKQPGDHFSAMVQPADAYGVHDAALVQKVPLKMFPNDRPIMLGQEYRSQSEQGSFVVRIVEIDNENVTVDGNHPLAGQTLNFDITVREARQATKEELEHGHAHGPDGHGHH
ncbi:MAG TPA: peptidylprolyl isomerase [Tepidisphaeraceae bacterium]|jgi:FKBP-type peptidyl-prolyl cis-trans isomerase SlyD